MSESTLPMYTYSRYCTKVGGTRSMMLAWIIGGKAYIRQNEPLRFLVCDLLNLGTN